MTSLKYRNTLCWGSILKLPFWAQKSSVYSSFTEGILKLLFATIDVLQKFYTEVFGSLILYSFIQIVFFFCYFDLTEKIKWKKLLWDNALTFNAFHCDTIPWTPFTLDTSMASHKKSVQKCLHFLQRRRTFSFLSFSLIIMQREIQDETASLNFIKVQADLKNICISCLKRKRNEKVLTFFLPESSPPLIARSRYDQGNTYA